MLFNVSEKLTSVMKTLVVSEISDSIYEKMIFKINIKMCDKIVPFLLRINHNLDAEKIRI